ncbi:hypothetical protein [Ralstonia phage phiRSL1]|uniref:PKD domain-containing protein n=1 Tax=Ralstonia phage phiRSL1 TaxID=1980924 RepID=B2ZY23_9CAUD|nr:hypothetical protein RSL1_ORF121 [Ralstonia phage phiRSL1]BAG41566.1 hypothetical protein [Ralstonia phage phiRSL1]
MSQQINHTQAKAALTAAGFPVSAGSNWNNVDQGSWDQFAASAAYGKVAYDLYSTNYGFSFPVMPDAVANAAASGAYSATLGVTPLTATHAVAITNFAWNLVETNGPGTSYVWDFGDGTGTTTTSTATGPANHTYATAGSYTPKVTVTVGGVPHLISAAAPVVVS